LITINHRQLRIKSQIKTRIDGDYGDNFYSPLRQSMEQGKKGRKKNMTRGETGSRYQGRKNTIAPGFQHKIQSP
jgi:hypothetical protein